MAEQEWAKVEWEQINGAFNLGLVEQTSRARVQGGWLVRTIVGQWDAGREIYEGQPAVAICFVPDDKQA